MRERLRYRLVLLAHTIGIHLFCRRTYVQREDPMWTWAADDLTFGGYKEIHS